MFAHVCRGYGINLIPKQGYVNPFLYKKMSLLCYPAECRTSDGGDEPTLDDVCGDITPFTDMSTFFSKYMYISASIIFKYYI